MLALSPQQMQVLERAFAAGFRPVAIPTYESALCVRRGDCAALLTAVLSGGLRLLAPPTLIVNGNLSVKLKRSGGDVFVWKKHEVPATPERLTELEKFRRDLVAVIEEGPSQ